MRRISKKGQLTLGDAPTVVLIVGLTFLVMATVALIGEKYNDSFPSDIAQTINGEAATATQISAGYTTAGTSQENAKNFLLIGVINGSGTTVANGNFTLGSLTGILTNTSSLDTFGTTYSINYSLTHAGIAANVTTSLNTEIANNTSIAGIVLTISLVGIVLSILVGVFLTIRRRTI